MRGQTLNWIRKIAPTGQGKTRFRLLALSALTAGACIASGVHGKATEESAPSADATAAPASLLAGAFTAEQVESGKAIYIENCAGCHGAALRGSPGGPPVVGFRFKQTWQGTPVGALFSFISTQMPPGKEGSLTEDQYLTTAAYILSKNGYPTGSTALPSDTGKLDEMIIEPLPASPAPAN